MRGSFRAHPTAPSPADAHAGISPVFLKLLADEPLEGRMVLDVGTGRGRLALTLAPRCGRVVGIDRDETALADARRAAAVAGLTNVEFVAVDAEAGEYAAFEPDAVVAHLCMSSAIAERAGRALARGAPFAFVAFHADQWKETGRRSRTLKVRGGKRGRSRAGRGPGRAGPGPAGGAPPAGRSAPPRSRTAPTSSAGSTPAARGRWSISPRRARSASIPRACCPAAAR